MFTSSEEPEILCQPLHHFQAATIAQELLSGGTSPTADAIAKKSSTSSTSLPQPMPQLPTSGEYKLSPTSISFEDLSKYLQTSINVDSSRMPQGAGPILTEGSFEHLRFPKTNI